MRPELLTCLVILLVSCLSVTCTRSRLASQEGGHCWSGRVGRKSCLLGLCSCSQLPILDVVSQGPWVSPSICLHPPPLSPGSFLQQIFTFSLRDPVFFPGPLLLFGNPSVWHHLFLLLFLVPVVCDADAPHVIRLRAGCFSLMLLYWWEGLGHAGGV